MMFADFWLLPPSGLLGLLFWVAVLCVVVWAIIALVRWSGLPIPEPVRIVFIALACIFLIALCFKIFALLMVTV